MSNILPSLPRLAARPTLFACTDGLIEQMNPDGIKFGINRLCNILDKNRSRNITLKELIAKINNSANNLLVLKS